MFTAVALFVSTAWMVSGIVYLFLYFTRRRRKSDFWYGVLAVALSLTYALYAFEGASPVIRYSELVIDGLIGLILLYNLRKLITYSLEKKDAGHR